jgi:hypothetical protein
MGRIKSASQKLKEATQAKAREDYYAKTKDTVPTTVNPIKRSNFIYASYTLKAGTVQNLFELNCSQKAVDFFGQTDLGLKDPQTAGLNFTAKPRGFSPAMLRAMKGATTPTARKSPWGSRVIKYSADTAGTNQAFYNAPLCVPGGATDVQLVIAKAKIIAATLYGGSALGNNDYARVTFSPEKVNFSLG